MDCTADLERRAGADDSGESPTVDNDHGSANGTADAEQGTVDDKEGTAEARFAARCNSGTRIAELHRIAVDEPSLPPRPYSGSGSTESDRLAGDPFSNYGPPVAAMTADRAHRRQSVLRCPAPDRLRRDVQQFRDLARCQQHPVGRWRFDGLETSLAPRLARSPSSPALVALLQLAQFTELVAKAPADLSELRGSC